MEVIQRFEQFYENLSLASIANLDDIYHPEITFVDPISKHHGLDSVTGYFKNLLENTTYCNCRIQDIIGENKQFSVIWEMHYAHSKLNGGREIIVNGTSHLKQQNDRIIMHRDYFDVGQMVYEQVPILRSVIKMIKKGMNQ